MTGLHIYEEIDCVDAATLVNEWSSIHVRDRI